MVETIEALFEGVFPNAICATHATHDLLKTL
jgi:hypothetical protein